MAAEAVASASLSLVPSLIILSTRFLSFTHTHKHTRTRKPKQTYKITSKYLQLSQILHKKK